MSYRANHRFEEELLREAVTRVFLQRQADALAREAKRIARAEAYDTGAYYDSLRGEVTVINGKPAGVVFSDVIYAPAIEVGSAHNRPVGTLRRAGESLRFH
jgi:hypothetical protein